MHNGMVRLDSKKMSKSVGNVFALHEALAAHGRDALLMYFLGGHYHQPIEFDDDRLSEAGAAAKRIREAGRDLTEGASPAWSAPMRQRFLEALANDFNTPRALAVVFEWVRRANRAPAASVGDADLREMLSVFALENLLQADETEVPLKAIRLLEARRRARADRDFAEADRIREQLRSLGWEVRDGPDGPELLPTR
jgi:cysteinyl-tRNA synthetase